MRPDWTTSGKVRPSSGLRRLRGKDEFKAFIIDWPCLDMNGIETVAGSGRSSGKVPIIILTAYDWADIEEEAGGWCHRFCGEAAVHAGSCASALTTPILVEEPEKLVGSGQFQGKKVLLVEDNELILMDVQMPPDGRLYRHPGDPDAERQPKGQHSHHCHDSQCFRGR